jgi:hypothetical protein
MYQATDGILEDTKKKDTDNYLKVLATTKVKLSAVISYWQKYLKILRNT